MSEAPAETTVPVALQVGDRVRIAENAKDGTGYGVPSQIRGEVGTLRNLDAYYGWQVRLDSTQLSYYVAAPFLTKLSEAELALIDRVATLTRELSAMTADRDVQAQALASFKTTTRTAIVSKAESGYDDDDNDFDDLLSDLGLEGRERDFEISVEFRGSYTTTITATSLREAEELAASKDAVVDYLSDRESALYALDSIEAEESE